MNEQHDVQQPEVHPLVRELLSQGEGKVVSIAGYVGPSDRGVLRLYADLGLRTYLEVPMASVVRIVSPDDDKNAPSVVLFRTDAEVTYAQTSTMRVDQVLASVAAAPPSPSGGSGHAHAHAHGCGCGGGGGGCGCGRGQAGTDTLARQSGGGGGGPIVDLCVWGCVERLRLCEARSGTLGRLWCYLNYGSCRLGCIDPPIIMV